MARAKAGTWFNLVAGLAVGATTTPLSIGAAPQFGSAAAERQVAQLSGRPSRASAALAGAAEAQRRGDYESAAGLLQQVAADAAGLSDAEQADLAQLLRENAAAQGLKARGQAPADKPATTGPGAMAAPGSALVNAQARAKLQMARTQMGQFNFDRAEQLCREAEKLQPKLNPGEDTPKKVLDDLAKMRSDPKALLTAARVALGRKDYDRAEQFAKLADKNASTFTFSSFWGDSPAKVLKDVKELRPIVAAKTPAKPAGEGVVTASVKPTEKAAPAAAPAVNGAAVAEQARALMKDAHAALAAGDLVKARKLNDQAKALKPNLSWWEDNPQKIQDEIVRAEMKAKPVAAKAAGAAVAEKPVDKSKTPTKEEAVALLKKGRTQLAENKLEEATQTALRAKAATSLSWGLFDDSPEKLRQDVDKARVKRDREESVKVLAAARQLYEEGKYDEASKAAFQAQKLHGAYNIWDLGDRPERVLADVQTAKTKVAKGQPVEVVKRDTSKKPAETVVQGPKAVGAPTPNGRDTTTRPMPAGSSAVVGAMPVPTGDLNKVRASQCLAEARQLQKDGKLLEARQKAIEAGKFGATFAAGEEGPEVVMMQLAAETRWQMDWLLKEAGRLTGTSGPDMAERFKKAEQSLVMARALAAGYGLDAQPVDAKLTWVRSQQPGGPALETGVAAASSPKNQGQVMLEQARLEIQRGETGNARKLAEQAMTGSFGVQDEAQAVLRSIDAEEFNQRRLQANRTFDAAMAAYNRRDYSHASNLLTALDANNLDGNRKARLREVSMTPEMRASKSPIVQVKAIGEPGLPLVPPVPGVAPAVEEKPGVAHVADNGPGETLLKTTEAMRQVKFQKLRQQGLDLQRDAAERFRTGQTDAAVEMLQDYVAQLADVELEPNQINLLRRPVESRLQQYKLLKAQRDFLTQDSQGPQNFYKQKNQQLLVEENKQKKVAELMKQFNTFFKEGKYLEAERLAMQAHELDPDNPFATTAVSMAKTQYRIATVKKTQSDKETLAWESLNGTDKFGPPGIGDGGLIVDKERSENARRRKSGEGIYNSHKSDKEREIEHRLSTPVNLNFTDTPLKNVIDDLRAWQGINIFIDEPALQEESVSLERPVSVKLEQVSLKSALNLLLHNIHLTYVIKDDVLKITTKARAKGEQKTVTYQVVDLVIPVENFGSLRNPNSGPLPGIDLARPTNAPSPQTPVTGPQTLTNGSSTGSPSGSSPFGTEASQPNWNKKNATNTTEETLIGLIKNTVAPNSWSDQGGAGTIDYFPLAMSLVINQTPDIQEQVADLLAALRRLQDQEVAVEVRLISLGDQFFERIGVDFNLNILTKDTHVQPSLTSGVFTPDGFINAFTPSRLVAGLQPTGTFTPDLNIPIRQQTFAQTIPTFGGYSGVPGFGGLTLGLAFLSDIQVFLFLEAVQGDTRNNVMQAPKLTLFNGQTATITVQDFQFFVTSVQVTPTQGVFTYQPQTQLFPLGVQLTIQAVISADRRFVRMSLAPNLTNLATSTINLFPVVVPIFPQFDNTGTGQPVVFTQYIQQPVINTIGVQTTVAVPDGGTVLMGGLKLLSEERKEYGPPVLSKIPYLNRLFKNTSYGRDAQSLLIMVTPRIIIQEEEEEKQTGYIRPVPPNF